jgi:4-alpha-glucanotransferase
MQDILGLDESARMNTPSSGNNNWGWRMLPGQVNNDTESMLKKWTNKYKR